MHSERFEIPQATADAIAATRAAGGRVIAVGTTSLRSLESAANADGTVKSGAGRNRHLHHPRLPLQGRRPADHQFPPAEIDAADAGFGLCRLRQHPRRLRPRRGRALPLLQLWRRHASGKIPMQFELLKTDGAARRGHTDSGPRHRRNARLHAGRHLRHGQGDDAARTERHRRADRASATPSTCGCGQAWTSSQAHGGLHDFMNWDEADPHRLRRLPGVLAGRHAQDHRGRRQVLVADEWRPSCFLTPEDLDADPEGAEFRHRDDFRRMHALSRRRTTKPPNRCACRCAGRNVRATNTTGWKTATRCSASSRAACTKTCATNRWPDWTTSASTAMAIGGLSVGEPKEDMVRILAHVAPQMPTRQAALPDGRRHAGRPGACGQGRASTCSTA